MNATEICCILMNYNCTHELGLDTITNYTYIYIIGVNMYKHTNIQLGLPGIYFHQSVVHHSSSVPIPFKHSAMGFLRPSFRHHFRIQDVLPGPSNWGGLSKAKAPQNRYRHRFQWLNMRAMVISDVSL